MPAAESHVRALGSIDSMPPGFRWSNPEIAGRSSAAALDMISIVGLVDEAGLIAVDDVQELMGAERGQTLLDRLVKLGTLSVLRAGVAYEARDSRIQAAGTA